MARLGSEAYGVIGFMGALQSWMSVFDIGVSQTIIRALSGKSAPDGTTYVRDLVVTFQIVNYAICAISIALLLCFSGWIAMTFLKAESIGARELQLSIICVSLIVVLRLSESVSRSVLVGLGRQVELSALNAFITSFRILGSVLVIEYYERSLTAFLQWNVVFALISFTIVLSSSALATRNFGTSGAFRWNILDAHYKGALGITAISLLGLITSNLDKLIVATMLPLAKYGQYMFAVAIASIVSQLSYPITQTLTPKYYEKHNSQQLASLKDTFHLGGQLISSIAGACGVFLMIFSSDILGLWENETAKQSNEISTLIAILCAGNVVSMLNLNYAQIQLVFGWTSLGFLLNLLNAIIVVPFLILLVPRFGANGAAASWLALVTLYYILQINIMHTKIFANEKWRYIITSTILPLGSAAIFLIATRFATSLPIGKPQRFASLTLILLIALSTALAASAYLRPRIVSVIRSSFDSLRSCV